MKARPRSVENRVADALNVHFAALGLSPVERIPVLGRSGPDISLNDLKLVIDVKSRKEVPKTIFFPLAGPFKFEGMTCIRLSNLNLLWEDQYDECSLPYLDFSSSLIKGYLAHMHDWTKENCVEGISSVILHRPEMPIGSSVVIIYSNSRRRLIHYAKRYSITNPGE